MISALKWLVAVPGADEEAEEEDGPNPHQQQEVLLVQAEEKKSSMIGLAHRLRLLDEGGKNAGTNGTRPGIGSPGRAAAGDEPEHMEPDCEDRSPNGGWKSLERDGDGDDCSVSGALSTATSTGGELGSINGKTADSPSPRPSSPDDAEEKLIAADEAAYRRTLRERRTMEHRELAESAQYKKELARHAAIERVFGSSHRTQEQIAHDDELARFLSTPVRAGLQVEGMKGATRGEAGRTATHSQTRAALGTSAGLADAGQREVDAAGRRRKARRPPPTSQEIEEMHSVNHCEICCAGLELTLTLSNVHGGEMATWCPPFRQLPQLREPSPESEGAAAQRNFAASYASGLLKDPTPPPPPRNSKAKARTAAPVPARLSAPRSRKRRPRADSEWDKPSGAMAIACSPPPPPPPPRPVGRREGTRSTTATTTLEGKSAPKVESTPTAPAPAPVILDYEVIYLLHYKSADDEVKPDDPSYRYLPLLNLRGRRVRCYGTASDCGFALEGRMEGRYVVCDCCDLVYAVGEFEAHAGNRSHRPYDSIFLLPENGEPGEEMSLRKFSATSPHPSYSDRVKVLDKVVEFYSEALRKGIVAWPPRIKKVKVWG
jgi:hypothetical protein